MMDIFEKCRTHPTVQNAEFAKSKDLYPYFHELQSRLDTRVVMEGKEKIMLGSNNYLSLTTDQRVIDAGTAALEQFGSGCSGSRFLNGTLTLHTKLERELAEFLGKEDCILFGTGFQANLGIIASIVGRHDLIFSDKENHASIYDACKLSYGTMIRYIHNDMADLEEKLANADPERGKLIVTDGVFSMSGDIAKLPQIVELGKKYNARIMVDDAHGIGVLGKNGRGTADFFGLAKDVDIIMGTFSKSLASYGGFCVCSKEVANLIRHISRPYIFCASPPPASVACANKALDILKEDESLVKDLLKIAKYVRAGLKKRGLKYHMNEWNNTPIIAVFTYTLENTFIVCKALFDAGVYVNPVVPPATIEGECLIRISCMSTLTKELVDQALDIIKSVFKELGII